VPYSFNGFGTRYYGEADLRPDGSFVTTTWLTALYIPLLPVGSSRLVRTGRMKHGFIHSSQSYGVVEELPICWPQVLRVYIFFAVVWGWLRFDWWLFFTKLKVADRPHETLNGFIFFFSIFLPFIALGIIRRRDYRARHNLPLPPHHREE